MENKNKRQITDAFGRELPRKTPEEITRDIERILNYVPKPKEKPTLEDSINLPQPAVSPPVANSPYQKVDYKELSKRFIPVYGVYHILFCNKCDTEESKLFCYSSNTLREIFFMAGPMIAQGVPWSILAIYS